MPSSQPLKVLVSGASGFIAVWVVRTILERGHHVRGTVRSNAKGDYLKRIFKDHGERFEYVIVQDIEEDGVFDDAVKGMDAIVHTASPFHLHADDPQELIGPAVKGTTSILESILKFAPNVKRVVITSSTAAVNIFPPAYDPPKSTYYTEKDWNTESPALVEEKGRDVLPTHKYRASKTLAERAAWEFVEKHKSEIKWKLVTLQPPFVFGPIIHDVPSASSLNTSAANFLTFLKNDPPQSADDLKKSSGSFVDVRDVAWAHAEALVNDRVANDDKNKAFGEGKGRVILSASAFTWQDVVDALNVKELPKTAPRGETGGGRNTVHPVRLENKRAQEELGLKFRPTSETFGDLLACFKERGWVA